jgi:hypothetical protein
MQNYSNDSSSVRVDFFRPSGKWYTTEAVKLNGNDYNTTDPVNSFRMVVQAHLNGRLKGMWAVCLQPYYNLEFPIMIKLDGDYT